jgi:2-polyprenyl-3-methyl-5-hydroxy-6-metoxy-1,4-benzoquinol methylase
MITKEEVVLAYQLFLGRDPENDSVIDQLIAEIENLSDLRKKLVVFPEFIQKLKIVPHPKLSMQTPPMQIDLGLSNDQLDQLLARTALQWKSLGISKPYWSVLTNPGYLNENIEQNKEAFYQSGQAELTNLFAALQRSNVSIQPSFKCLEFGCGVGRVTGALATHFASVMGVDVSYEHLQLAESYIQEQGLANVELAHLTNLQELSQLGNFDFLYSQIVFQHNPPPVTKFILEQLLSQLNPNGLAYFQIPTYKIGYSFSIEQYLNSEDTPEMEMHYLPQDQLFSIITKANCTILEMREDTAIGPSLSAISNTILLKKNID